MAWLKKILGRKSVIISILIIAVIVFFLTRKEEGSFAAKYEGYDLSQEEEEVGRSNTYTKYLRHHETAAKPAKDIPIDLFSYSSGEGVSVLENFEGEAKVLKTEEDSYLEYKVNVEEAGLYNIALEYFPVQSRGIDIERWIQINGETPFLGAEAITFHRIWGDAEGGIKKDNQGNDIRPTQVEKPRWEKATCDDYMGYYTEPFEFYLESGENTISIKGINEPMVLRKLTLAGIKELKKYDEYIKDFDLSQYQNSDTAYLEKIQGESAIYRSSPSLYANCDRSSGITEPTTTGETVMNMIGGEAWKVAGQWIEWDFEVPEDGMYKISVKGRQNYNRGYVSNRTIKIDGEIPCEEAKAIAFRYSNTWNMTTVSDADGNDLYFPLKAGKHTIHMEVTLGELGNILTTIEESIFRVNEIYRKILVLTGAEPDKYRDYRIEQIYPEAMKGMELEYKILYRTVDELTAYSGERGAQAASVQTLAKQLEKFSKSPEKIPKTMLNFKENISGLGNALVALADSQLDVDYLVVSAKEAKLPTVKESFWTKAGHELIIFANSFFRDYNSLGNVYSGKDAIDVWMMAGRDQSTILKTMIDDTFTPNTGINVNVKLITQDALMPAVVAGTGPDVAITVQQGDPVNYALRHAAMDISQFSDYDQVVSEYYDSSIIPYKYEGGVYGLPDTQLFNIMFYRKDILEQFNLEVPETWDDLIKILPIIQKNNMNIGIPTTERKINNIIYPDLSNFFAQLYQRGGALYNENGSKVLLDGEQSVEAFETYTRFFTHYKTPIVYEFANRFRTGEMPIGICDYDQYNTLIVFAPEIRGLWDIALVPGIRKEDGTVDHSLSAWGNASMILENTDNKEGAWEFLKWWASSDTKVRFGRELEALMGASARYATANKVAFKQLSWSADNMATLDEQWRWVVGTPEVAGGYYTSRHIINSIRRVINKNEDARETLLDYTRTINDELYKKRIEFGLEEEPGRRK